MTVVLRCNSRGNSRGRQQTADIKNDAECFVLEELLQTKLFLFTARTTQKLLAHMRGSLHSTGCSERELILFADSPNAGPEVL